MQQLEAVRSVNISPKAALAFLYPFIATVAAVAASWIVTGQFNDGEVRTALSGLVASGIAALGAYVGKPGQVVAEPVVNGNVDPVVPPGIE